MYQKIKYNLLLKLLQVSLYFRGKVYNKLMPNPKYKPSYVLAYLKFDFFLIHAYSYLITYICIL